MDGRAVRRSENMEMIVTAAIVIVLALCLGADLAIVPIMLMVIMTAVLIFIFFFFAVCAVRLLRTEKKRAFFSRIGQKGKDNFSRAFYNIGSEEYPNVYPCEIVMRSKLYRHGKEYTVRFDRRHGEVFDLNAVCCTVAGLVLGGGSAVMMILFTLTVIGV